MNWKFFWAGVFEGWRRAEPALFAVILVALGVLVFRIIAA